MPYAFTFGSLLMPYLSVSNSSIYLNQLSVISCHIISASFSLLTSRHVDLCHALTIKASEACRACDKLNVTQMGGVVSPFDPSSATEGQTLTNTCQTKLLGTTKDSFMVPLDLSQGLKPQRELARHTQNGTTDRNENAIIEFEASQILWCMVKCARVIQCMIVLKEMHQVLNKSYLQV